MNLIVPIHYINIYLSNCIIDLNTYTVHSIYKQSKIMLTVMIIIIRVVVKFTNIWRFTFLTLTATTSFI